MMVADILKMVAATESLSVSLEDIFRTEVYHIWGDNWELVKF